MKTGDKKELNRRLVEDDDNSDHEDEEAHSPKKGKKETGKAKQPSKSIPLCGFFKIR